MNECVCVYLSANPLEKNKNKHLPYIYKRNWKCTCYFRSELKLEQGGVGLVGSWCCCCRTSLECVYTCVCLCVCVYVGMFIMCRTGLECNKSNLQSCQQEAARATLTKTTTTTTTSIRKQQQCVMPHPLPNVVGSSLGATTKSVDLGPWGVFLCVGVGEYMYNTYIHKFYSTYYMYKLHICNLFSPHRYKASHCANK